MHQIYILLSLKDNRTYVGRTQNLVKRLKEHNDGRVRSTAHRRPLRVFYVEPCPSLAVAKARELWWKSSSGRLKLRELFRAKTNQ